MCLPGCENWLDENRNLFTLILFLQVRWLKVNFSEAYIAWIHIKVRSRIYLCLFNPKKEDNSKRIYLIIPRQSASSSSPYSASACRSISRGWFSCRRRRRAGNCETHWDSSTPTLTQRETLVARRLVLLLYGPRGFDLRKGLTCTYQYFSMPHLCSSSIFRRTFPRALASDRGSTIPMFISRLTSTWLGTNQSCNCFVMICAMPIYWLLSCVMHLVFQCLNTSILSQISRCVPIASFAWFSWFILY